MASRLQQVASHIAPGLVSPPSQGPAKIGVKSPNDVVVVSALRTPIARARKGAFKDTVYEELLAAIFKATLEKTKIDPALIQDVCVGTVLPSRGGAGGARRAALYAGIPDTAGCSSLNRQCSSGLQAVATIATAISYGLIDVGLAAGVESMSHGYGDPPKEGELSERMSQENQQVADCLIPMGITSENVAEKFNVSREKQDQFAARSHKLAHQAQQNGWFDEEIAPVTTTLDGKTVTVTKDEGIRPNTTPESLAKLKPAFKPTGSTHAGNASQVSDGAAAVLLMRRSKAQELGLPILGKYVISAVVGVPPNIMGIGPAFAIPIALEKAGLRKEDVDIYEINEAFASQAVYSVEKVGIPLEKVNPKGGAIALGHPLGCTGARQVATLFPELKRQGKRIGITSMCMGTGMGMAAVSGPYRRVNVKRVYSEDDKGPAKPLLDAKDQKQRGRALSDIVLQGIRLPKRFASWESIPRLLSHIIEVKGAYYALASLFTINVVRGVEPVMNSYLTKCVLDSVITAAKDPSRANELFEYLIVRVFFDLITTIAEDQLERVTNEFTVDVSQHFRIMAMKHTAQLDLAALESPETTKRLNDAQAAVEWAPLELVTDLLRFLQFSISAVSLLWFLMGLDWYIPLLACLVVLPDALSRIFSSRRQTRRRPRFDDDRLKAQYYSRLLINPEANKEIKLFGLIDYFVDAFTVVSNRSSARLHEEAKVRRRLDAVIHSINVSGQTFIYYLFAQKAINGHISIGDVSMYTSSTQRLGQLLRQIARQVASSNEVAANIKLFFDFLDTKPSIASPVHGRKLDLEDTRGIEIEFRSVTFTYPDRDKPAIRNVSFTIGKSESVVVVGTNGAGKTTLVKLLTRLYDPQEGDILVNGHNIKEYDLEDLRSHISVIFQDFVRYQGTVQENIGVGNIDHITDDDAIRHAAAQSGALEVTQNLDKAFGTVLGHQKSGTDLSGGQWQKIALARAFLRENARLMVLDEPTSALDPQAEYEVFVKFNVLKAGKTALFISHRFSSVRFADKILVIEHGELLEEGSHQTLMARQVYQSDEHKSSWSHELIGGAAGFEAMRLYEQKCEREGKPQSHALAKEILAGIAAAEIDKLAETKGLDFIDREKAKYHAREAAKSQYDQQYGQ
ncbi:hypothetical protein BZG36_00874 [Bifiguratus adelaidae]|uniref:acetyl-CoA C-acyltransferase n=1 Tax=Bifiguratus adelaidae TaxID=1938954 RepID=A0A261Y5C2_9FUNG|nr:hypothetical protein BZG36_00874 [Bifiguratus adelaidae]